MSWRDRLRPASFRDAKFHIDTTGKDAGRKVQSHQFPLIDGSSPEDLGQGGTMITLSGYVIGPDYDEARDKLEAALDMPGPGMLVHPTRGEMMVQAHRYKVSEEKGRAGMARFDLTFERTALNLSPRVMTDTSSGARDAADRMAREAIDRFVLEFDIGGLPDWASDIAVSGIIEPAKEILDALRRAAGAELSKVTDTLTKLIDAKVEDVVADVRVFGRMIVDGVRNIVDTLSEKAAETVLDAVMKVEMNALDAISPSRLEAEAKRTAARTLWRAAILVGRVEAASRRVLMSVEETLALRKKLTEDLAKEALRVADAGARALHKAIRNVIAAISTDLTERAIDLPHVTDVEAGPGPVLTLSQKLYRTGERAREIARMAHAWHPGFHSGKGRLLAR